MLLLLKFNAFSQNIDSGDERLNFIADIEKEIDKTKLKIYKKRLGDDFLVLEQVDEKETNPEGCLKQKLISSSNKLFTKYDTIIIAHKFTFKKNFQDFAIIKYWGVENSIFKEYEYILFSLSNKTWISLDLEEHPILTFIFGNISDEALYQFETSSPDDPKIEPFHRQCYNHGSIDYVKLYEVMKDLEQTNQELFNYFCQKGYANLKI